ncbi:hypothetical protein V499_00610 [Pseudogymnoascus sp. VKM F-103]|nr:hypothetical protein V499_00610 [Pseudogymnoascus sp. VKM F-103]
MDTDFTEIGSGLRSLGTAIGKRLTIVDAFCGKEVDDKNVAKSAGDAHRHDAFSCPFDPLNSAPGSSKFLRNPEAVLARKRTASLPARVECRANTNQMDYSCNDYQDMENLMGASEYIEPTRLKHENYANDDLGT